MSSLMMSDTVLRVTPGQTPDYNSRNPLTKLLGMVETHRLAAERHFYLTDELQALVPFSHLDFAGPQGADADILDPTRQDNKTDFQKQNVRDFLVTDTYLLRGWVTPRAWKDVEAFDPMPERIVPFLKLSYRAGPDSKLAEALGRLPGQSIRLFLKVNGREAGGLITVPYNEATDRYEIELWGDHGSDLRAIFSSGGDERGLASLDRGELITRPDMIRGLRSDFDREGKDDVDVRIVSSDCTMHPLLPTRIEVAWADETGQSWDSNEGANYHYEFNMMLRGWDAYLKAGISANPHGGLGFLHYRNLLSNYFGFAGSGELGRTVEPWQFDAMGGKADGERREGFFAIDYADLHILKNNCGIGIHRHRDNQEIFFLLEGQAVMVTGDWYRFPDRERCFELRTLRPGHFALLKPGGLHGMMNATDSDIHLLMFGGYD
ncbi:cupin domain-containing protein [Bradyrhizobium sp. URHD0069]|uniref:cupin domain-containing protein n=1 Tax=Bradyrhizobium sp. URHD0069 TaxID=1380355 RepID=UPI000494E4C7|nr:cupin domain-containing protein [Bradyrhizobium sp. URHD0069]